MIHPELTTVLPYTSGRQRSDSGPFLGGYMEIKAPNESATLTGRSCGRLVNDLLAGDDVKRAYYYTLMPNMMLSHPSGLRELLSAHAGAVDRTIVESEWMFSPRATKAIPSSTPTMRSTSGT